MRRPRSSNVPDRLALWLWGGVGAVVVLLVVLVLSSGDETEPQDDPFLTVATVVSSLGAYGTPSGEGLTRTELTAAAGKTGTIDGGRDVPQGTVDGPGRRLFAGVTVRLPKARQPWLLRQITPADLPSATDRSAFVRWDGWVAVLDAAQVRAGARATGLRWQKAAGTGLEVPAGATVRLRTMFRITDDTGRCVGPSLPAGSAGHRAEEVLRRAPAWMVRRPARTVRWQWLRTDSSDVSGLPTVVRSGPVRTVLFRASNVCRAQQSSVTVDPDPDPLTGGDLSDALPQDPASGY